MKRTITLAVLGSLLAASAHAAVLAGWNFETNIPPTVLDSATGYVIAAEIGSGSFSGLHASTATDWIAALGNGSATATFANNWTTGDYYQFSTSSTGYEGITISFDSVGQGPGAPRDFQLAYSSDGTNFTNFGTVYAIQQNFPTAWSSTTPVPGTSYSFDLSGISALDDMPTIYFRVSQVGTASVGGGVISTGASVRMDNVVISGTAVPEPSTTLLGAIGLIGLLRRRR